MKIAATPQAVAAMVKAEEKEVERAAFWLLVPPPARVIAMMVARLPRDRAGEPLTAFSTAERRLIALALQTLESHIGMALRCMRDDVPATKAHLH